MNTIELMRALKGCEITRKYISGVYAADMLPETKLKKKPAILIANTDGSDKPGEHWVAFYFPRTGDAEFFDSFGNRPKKIEFLRFLRRNSLHYTYNKKRLQSDFSTTCGLWCCVYLHQKCMGKKMSEITSMFSQKNRQMNDEKVKSMYDRIFKPSLAQKSQRGGRRKSDYIIQSCKSRNQCIQYNG